MHKKQRECGFRVRLGKFGANVMSKNVLLQPLRNVADPEEGSVLSILSHLMPVLEDWRIGEDFRLEQEELLEQKPILEEEIRGLEDQASATKSQIENIFKNFKYYPLALSLFGVVLSAIGFLSVNFDGFLYSQHIGFLGLSVAVGGVGKLLYDRSIYLKKFRSISASLDQKRADLDAVSKRIEELRKELLARADTFPEVVHAKINFPMAAFNVLGNYVLIDETGLYDSETLETIDLSDVQTDLESIIRRIEGIKTVPVLLSPESADKSQDAIESLFGEEQVIQNLVNDFTSTLRQIHDVELKIPLVGKDSYLAERLGESDLGESESWVSLVDVRNNGLETAQLQSFVDQVEETKEFGTKVLKELKDTFDNLQNICQAYSFARSNSVNALHSSLFEVLNKASWCSKRFYCPRSIQAPAYMEDLLQVHPEDAHRLAFDNLIQNLRQDEVIAKRLDANPQMVDELYANHQAVDELSENMAIDEGGNIVDNGDSPAYLTDQYEESLIRFRRSLKTAMTGSPNPVLSFSAEAELYYDPEMEEWRSETIPYVYDTATVLRYGQVLKVTSDLMIPLWEHLWTEKADFRKSELFRTNDSLIRMTEKESEKLIEVGNQFKADMRTVRENIYLLESDLRSKYDELIAFRNGMDALGLLSDRQKVFLTDEKLKELSIGEKSVLKEAQNYELLLGVEPRVQAERRGTLNDPIELARAPDVLISYTADTPKRLSAN